MQALRLWLLMPLVAPVAAQSSDWAKVDLGEQRVPAACPVVRAPAQQPQQQQAMKQQQAMAAWDAGSMTVSLRAWPSQRLRDRQSIRIFESCAQSGAKRVPPVQLVGAERAAEEALKASINQCLGAQQQSFTARSVVLSRSAVKCS